jgi:CubicO group peptidase (beta-lactamase class C family)
MMIRVLRKRLSLILLMFSSLQANAQMSKHVANISWLNRIKEASETTVLLNNSKATLPLKNLQDKRLASVSLGSYQSAIFDSVLNKYARVSSISVTYPVGQKRDLNSLGKQLKNYNSLVIQVTDAALNEVGTLPFILENQKSKEVILVVYGNQRILGKLDTVVTPIVWSKQETPESAQFTAELIFGGTAARAKLNQTVSVKYKQGEGAITRTERLDYSVPEAVGINAEDLETPIDAIVSEAINQKATPGAVVLVAKEGKVILNKAYGRHTYESIDLDKVTDIFDLASVTKISATTLAAMRLYEQGKLKLDSNVGAYIPEARNTDKSNIFVRNLMLHQAGLVSYIPFYQNIRPEDFSRDSSELYNVKVADNFYIRKGYYEDVMWPQMLHSRLETPGKYVYSDLSMYIMKEIIERQTAQPLSSYVLEEFYQPLGMQTAGYNPRYRFSRSQIVPTENDTYFRKTLLQGFVHDQGAAMVGGVSGHAGVFSSANDLAILFQMMLNKGTYGGVDYFKPGTVEMFTARQSAVSRRGLGFDRWDPETRTYPSELASPETYGHTGFTGTCVWVDPKYKLIYIFLSNRVNSPGGNKLQSMKIRSRIQDAIYRAIIKGQNSILKY